MTPKPALRLLVIGTMPENVLAQTQTRIGRSRRQVQLYRMPENYYQQLVTDLKQSDPLADGAAPALPPGHTTFVRQWRPKIAPRRERFAGVLMARALWDKTHSEAAFFRVVPWASGVHRIFVLHDSHAWVELVLA